MFFSMIGRLLQRVTYGMLSNNKLHQALPLTKTSFPRTSVRYIPTAGYLILLHYSAELFGVSSTELYFRCGFWPANDSQTPPRKQSGDDRRLVILPRRRLSNQSTKFHCRGCFLFIVIERADRERERNQGFGGRERDVHANSTKRLEARRETCRMRENR